MCLRAIRNARVWERRVLVVDVRKRTYVRQLRTDNDPFGRTWWRFRSYFRFGSDDRQSRCRPRKCGPVREDVAWTHSWVYNIHTVYARLTMRKVMASLFEKVLVSRKVSDLTDDGPPGISRLPKEWRTIRFHVYYLQIFKCDHVNSSTLECRS